MRKNKKQLNYRIDDVLPFEDLKKVWNDLRAEVDLGIGYEKLRDFLIFSLILYYGKRRSEVIVHLAIDDIDIEKDTIKFAQLKRGDIIKREYPLLPILKTYIMRYVRYVRSIEPERTRFFDITGRQAYNRINFIINSSDHVELKWCNSCRESTKNNEDIKNKCIKCGYHKKFRPHALRHAVANYLLRTNGDVEQVRRLLGLRSIETAMIYFEYSVKDLYDKLPDDFKKFDDHPLL